MGKKGAGKTTAVGLLEEAGCLIANVNFKDALIRELKQGFPDLLEHISRQTGLTSSELFDRKPPVIRKLLQNYGTEVRRVEDIDYWVKKWKASIDKIASDTIIVDDVRFENEANAVKRAGGMIVRIVSEPDSNDTHTSETEQDSIEADLTIINTMKGRGNFYDSLEPLIDIINEEELQCED